MARYKYNPDSHKVHNIAQRTAQCNFNEMDGDEYDFNAGTNSEAIRIAKSRFSTYASGCGHCM